MEFGLFGRLTGVQQMFINVCLSCLIIYTIGTQGEKTAVESSSPLETSKGQGHTTSCQNLLAEEGGIAHRVMELVIEINEALTCAKSSITEQKRSRSDDVFVPAGLDNFATMAAIFDKLRKPMRVSNINLNSLRERMLANGKRK